MTEIGIDYPMLNHTSVLFILNWNYIVGVSRSYVILQFIFALLTKMNFSYLDHSKHIKKNLAANLESVVQRTSDDVDHIQFE